MFRKFIFSVLLIVFFTSSAFSAQVCDFDGNSSINDTDLIVLLAYLQVKGLADLGIGTLDVASVQSAARTILNSTTLTVVRLPITSSDDLEADSTAALGDNDLILMLVYLQKKGLADLGIGTLDFDSIQTAAGSLLSKTLSMGKFPGTEIGSSTVPITITGIQTN
jgi:hypothetical protein